ncbi:MAG TPA: glycosyltransferase family 2 protein [Candidatus Dependentiae bacterium]|nr:glycosyltransferase family 2 protein [Candidatus Dependentiae bacterium]HRQ63117.1 glycosyltransferase family 2 protein [Candidatus Dependentiae bacterium]
MKNKKFISILLMFVVIVHNPLLSLTKKQTQSTEKKEKKPKRSRIRKVLGEQRRMVIVTPSYNNATWYRRNIDSIFKQKYDNYILVYIDDCSTDGTADFVKQLVEEYNQAERVYLVRNEYRRGALANIYYAIYTFCNDDDIVVLLDGDDWFKRDSVLITINEAYKNPHVWLTYGQMQEYPSRYVGYCKPLDQEIVQQAGYRQAPWCTSHLRTFYAWLFKQIKYDDFLDSNGDFLPMAWDMALMFPMLEMVDGKYKFIEDVLYVYNMYNNLNDNKVDPELQRDCEQYIRNKQPYKRLKNKSI